MEKLKTFFANWKTSVPGLLATVCAAGEWFEFLPDQWRTKATVVCTALVGLGLIAAKDADRSNAPVPAEKAAVVR